LRGYLLYQSQNLSVHSAAFRLCASKPGARYELELGGFPFRIYFQLRFSGDHVAIDQKDSSGCGAYGDVALTWR
jgi:hypothetical protein